MQPHDPISQQFDEDKKSKIKYVVECGIWKVACSENVQDKANILNGNFPKQLKIMEPTRKYGKKYLVFKYIKTL